jgi:hypothetical protein
MESSPGWRSRRRGVRRSVTTACSTSCRCSWRARGSLLAAASRSVSFPHEDVEAATLCRFVRFGPLLFPPAVLVGNRPAGMALGSDRMNQRSGCPGDFRIAMRFVYLLTSRGQRICQGRSPSSQLLQSQPCLRAHLLPQTTNRVSRDGRVGSSHAQHGSPPEGTLAAQQRRFDAPTVNRAPVYFVNHVPGRSATAFLDRRPFRDALRFRLRIR